MAKKIKKVKPIKKSVAKTSHEIVVRVQPVSPEAVTTKDLAPIQSDGGKYMIPKTWLSERQVVKMVQNTPPQHIYTRPGKGGQRWSYVTGNYVEKVLNYTFGWNWDFEVQSHGKEQDMVWVLGKLTVKDDKGHTITKSQFGRADIKFKKDTKIMLDFGNDLKSATTDALKKCASLLGIASDVYGKTEIKHETDRDVVDATKPPTTPITHPSDSSDLKKGQVIGPDGNPTYVCSVCGDPIDERVYDYSMKMFKKPLCREHQPKK
jgi:hypothetical protein